MSAGRLRAGLRGLVGTLEGGDRSSAHKWMETVSVAAAFSVSFVMFLLFCVCVC